MKRFLTLLLFLVFLAAGCSKSDPKPGTDGPDVPAIPRVTTAVVEQYGTTTAVVGGLVADAELSTLTQVGVQYVEWESDATDKPSWDAATTLAAPKVAAAWSMTAEGLSPATGYAVRAFVRIAEAEYFGAVTSFTTDSESLVQPVVTTAEVTQFDAVSALLGGEVTDATQAMLTQVGVQYVVWGDAETLDNLDWSKAVDCKADVNILWSVRAEGLSSETQYGVRAFVNTADRRYFGAVKSFTTLPIGRKPLTVADLWLKYAASADVSQETVRGYVALSIARDCQSESFAAGTIILYDNTGAPGTALMCSGDASDAGLGAAGLLEGDYIEVTLAEAQRQSGNGPHYGNITRDAVRIISRSHKIDPVWVTPAQLTSNASGYVWSPVRLSRLYAEKPGELFSAADNWFTDGEARVAVWAKAGSVVGLLTQNGATGTLCGVCSYDTAVRIVPTKASDVAAFTGDDPMTEGDPKIEILNTEYYEFAPQGGTLVVDCKVTRSANLRLFADTRFIDTGRYSIDIEGDRVSITARTNTSGLTADYSNCYLYLAESKDASRKATATLRVTQLSSPYESLPALFQANGGELSSVHEAIVNGYQTRAMKLGSGNYTGYYTSDPTAAVGSKRLVFYAVGWQESKHEAGTLYLRVENGGSAAVGSIALKINAGATGQAPFLLTVGNESRYEVALTGLTPGSVISFSTSPGFDKKADDKTARALLFGVQVVD